MNAQFVAELIVAIVIAVAVVRYWKVILAVVAVVVLTLAVIGAMTVLQHLP